MSYAVQEKSFSVDIVSSSFKDNRALAGGSVFMLDLKNSSLYIRDSIFDGNTAVKAGSSKSSDGGAIALSNLQQSSVDVRNCIFRGNKAPRTNGGAASASFITNTLIKFINCSFYENYAGNRGGVRLLYFIH